jgi:hypothetical protein
VWDDNESGVINLLEFAEIIRDLQVCALPTATPAPEASPVASPGTRDPEICRAATPHNTPQVFEQFDLDRSGSISVVELRNALAKLGVQLSHPATRGLLLKYDSDGSVRLAWLHLT